MFRFNLNLETGELGGAALQDTGALVTSGPVVSLSAPLFGKPELRIFGFFPSENLNVASDLGSDPDFELIIKDPDADQPYDGPVVIQSPIFTRVDGGATVGIYYRATLNLQYPALLKRMGVDPLPAVEQIVYTPIADTEDALNGRYLDLYYTLTSYYRLYCRVAGHADNPPAAGTGGTVVPVDFADTSSASDIATAFVGVINSAPVSTYYSAVTETDAFSVTATGYGQKGPSSAGNTGFGFILNQAGADGLGEADIDSLSLNAWLKWVGDDGAENVTPVPFTLTILNTGYRPSAVVPLGDTTRTRRGSVALGNGVSSKSVTFATPFVSSSWVFRDVRVVNTTDGSPDNIMVSTLTARSASGFTVLLSGPTNSANYTLEYTCDYVPT